MYIQLLKIIYIYLDRFFRYIEVNTFHLDIYYNIKIRFTIHIWIINIVKFNTMP